MKFIRWLYSLFLYALDLRNIFKKNEEEERYQAWLDAMPAALSRRLDGLQKFKAFNVWWIPQHDEHLLKSFPVYVKSPYRGASRIDRHARREEIKTRWNARKLARTTVMARGVSRAVRL